MIIKDMYNQKKNMEIKFNAVTEIDFLQNERMMWFKSEEISVNTIKKELKKYYEHIGYKIKFTETEMQLIAIVQTEDGFMYEILMFDKWNLF